MSRFHWDFYLRIIMLVYSTSTADIGPYDPFGYMATPYDLDSDLSN